MQDRCLQVNFVEVKSLNHMVPIVQGSSVASRIMLIYSLKLTTNAKELEIQFQILE
jgi:hypothetical protein